MQMELFVGSNKQSLFLDLLSHYTQSVDKNLVRVLRIRPSSAELLKLPELPFVVTPSGELLSGEIEISEIVSKISGYYEVLFGKIREEAFEKYDFIKYLNQNSSNLLQFLNLHLQTKTYCTGFSISISDLYAYASVIPELVKLGEKDKFTFCNVIRWADHLQSLQGLKMQVKDLKMRVSIPFEPLFLDPEINPKVEKAKDKKEKNKGENRGENPKNENKGENSKNEGQEKPQKEEKKQEPQGEKKDTKPQQPKEEKKEAKKEQPKKEQPKKGGAKEEDNIPDVSKLDIRVGKMVSIVENLESEKLYNEEIDIGNGEIRKIASGLKGRVDINELRDSMVVVITNLKERTLCGWPSHGMILCANGSDGSVEPLRPPEGSQAGDQVFIGDFPRQPVQQLNPKKNPWDNVKEDFVVNASKTAVYKDGVWKTNKGIIHTKSLTNAKIS
jgi:methionine--tRNA ligase beta chain